MSETAKTNGVVFSVIIPCYNSQSYVRDAVESVINQTYKNIEVVLIDDGSTDDTLKILNEYAEKDARVKVYQKENGGYPTAVNYGLERITGDYFLMMGSDDKLCLNILEETEREISGFYPDIVAFKVIKHYVDGSKADEMDRHTEFDEFIEFEGDFVNYYKVYKHEADFLGERDTGKIYKKSTLGDLRYFGSYGFDADGIFSLMFAHKCHRFAVVPVEGYVWSLRNDSLSGKEPSPAVQLDRLCNWSEFLKFLNKMPKKEISEKDCQYAQKSYNLVHFLSHKAKKVYLKNYFEIYKYLFRLRKFGYRNKEFKILSKRIILNSYFPLLSIIIGL